MEAFIDYQRRNAVKIIFPSFQFNVCLNCLTTQKFCIVVEKIDELNLMQIRLTDAYNQAKIFICTIDNTMYDRIRGEQSLNVSFQGFLDHLIRILESCRKAELFMSLVKEDSVYILQFYEKRSFKNLTHLYLIVNEAPNEAVLYHINQALNTCQQQVHTYTNQTISLQREINARDHSIGELRQEITSLNGKLNEQEKLIFNRNTEEVSRLQQTIKHLDEAKELEEKRLKWIICEQQVKVDGLLKEKYSLNDRLAQETNKCEAIQEDIKRFRHTYNILKDDNTKLLSDISQYHNRDERNESVIIGLRKQVIELQGQVKAMEKQQSGLKAEVDAEKNICQSKKNALEMATQDLSHCNELICRQNKEMMVLREKIKTRTEVAINQEQFVKKIEKENLELSEKLRMIYAEHAEHRRQHDEFGSVLTNIQQSATLMEQKYQKKIDDLLVQLSEVNNTGNKTAQLQNNQRNNRHLRMSNHQQYF